MEPTIENHALIIPEGMKGRELRAWLKEHKMKPLRPKKAGMRRTRFAVSRRLHEYILKLRNNIPTDTTIIRRRKH